jgi:hypothetical protein
MAAPTVIVATLENEWNGHDAAHHDGASVAHHRRPAPVPHGVERGAIQAGEAARAGDGNVGDAPVDREQDANRPDSAAAGPRSSWPRDRPHFPARSGLAARPVSAGQGA